MRSGLSIFGDEGVQDDVAQPSLLYFMFARIGCGHLADEPVWFHLVRCPPLSGPGASARVGAKLAPLMPLLGNTKRLPSVPVDLGRGSPDVVGAWHCDPLFWDSLYRVWVSHEKSASRVIMCPVGRGG